MATPGEHRAISNHARWLEALRNIDRGQHTMRDLRALGEALGITLNEIAGEATRPSGARVNGRDFVASARAAAAAAVMVEDTRAECPGLESRLSVELGTWASTSMRARLAKIAADLSPIIDQDPPK